MPDDIKLEVSAQVEGALEEQHSVSAASTDEQPPRTDDQPPPRKKVKVYETMLPAGWSLEWSPEWKAPYYWNSSTSTSTWHWPGTEPEYIAVQKARAILQRARVHKRCLDQAKADAHHVRSLIVEDGWVVGLADPGRWMFPIRA